MNYSRLGEAIIKQRKLLKMTQIDLCQDICSQSAISQIEKGSVLPNLDTLYAISLRLRVPVNYFINLLIDENFEEINKVVIDLERKLSKHLYQETYLISNKQLEQKNPQKQSWYYFYLFWINRYSAHKIGNMDAHKCLIELKGLLVPQYELILRKNLLDYRILNTIAVIYASIGDSKLANYYYNKILSKPYSSNSSLRQNPDIYLLQTMYNKVKTLYDTNNFDNAILIIEQGIQKSKELENVSFVGHFYYYLGLCYEKTNKEFNEISDCFQKAYYHFEFLDKRGYLDVLRNLKSQYLTKEKPVVI
ncbi:MAG: helix-turn-helix transcriptional regulator [Bacillaceae bacterium]|nr:helix-turn-helix transcriptional regulator [Bacillaceae bacterium]